MATSNYEAGNGEDKVYVVLVDGYSPTDARNLGNARITAETRASKAKVRAVVYNREAKEIVEVYDFRLTAGPAEE